ncbi:putative C-type lectin domain family 20 member A [Clarias gariepinus]
MKLHVFLLMLFTGPVPVTPFILLTVPHRYELIRTSMSWAAAQDYCRARYTNLAIILSYTDWLRFNKETTSKGLTTPAWVGLWNDVNSWRWSLGDLPLKSVTYTNWQSGQPDNLYGHEACVIIGAPNLWFDTVCAGPRPFICYDSQFSNTSRFIIINSPWLPWLNARAYCRQHHTDLASSLNSSDNIMIGQLAGLSTYPWIGLYRDTWKWSDGTNATNLPWAPRQPDNSGGNEKCAIVSNDTFSDVTCTNLNYFVCHTDFPTRSQIIRLQVVSDGSVFDPAVQSFILKLIKQQLEKNGMFENTTVTWSVQPDGNIFHKKKGIEYKT